jgi:predicted DNA-binding transcriptional regulator AlpA
MGLLNPGLRWAVTTMVLLLGSLTMTAAGAIPRDSGGPELLTIRELASRLTVSVGCIRAWRLRGEGPPAIRVGTALRWDAREVAAWIDANRESGMTSGRVGLDGSRQ